MIFSIDYKQMDNWIIEKHRGTDGTTEVFLNWDQDFYFKQQHISLKVYAPVLKTAFEYTNSEETTHMKWQIASYGHRSTYLYNQNISAQLIILLEPDLVTVLITSNFSGKTQRFEVPRGVVENVLYHETI